MGRHEQGAGLHPVPADAHRRRAGARPRLRPAAAEAAARRLRRLGPARGRAVGLFRDQDARHRRTVVAGQQGDDQVRAPDGHRRGNGDRHARKSGQHPASGRRGQQRDAGIPAPDQRRSRPAGTHPRPRAAGALLSAALVHPRRENRARLPSGRRSVRAAFPGTRTGTHGLPRARSRLRHAGRPARHPDLHGRHLRRGADFAGHAARHRMDAATGRPPFPVPS